MRAERSPYSPLAKILANELAEKAAANLRRAGWGTERDQYGIWTATRPTKEERR